MEKALPAIPVKRYFTIGEVSELCGVKPYVLRYWEQEFTQLKPMKRRGNRRYYQHHEVLLIRRIRELLYDQGFTISGARNRLSQQQGREVRHEPSINGHGAAGLSANGHGEPRQEGAAFAKNIPIAMVQEGAVAVEAAVIPVPEVQELSLTLMRRELLSIRGLLLG